MPKQNGDHQWTPDPEPVRRLRRHLDRLRARGVTFSEAWPQALSGSLSDPSERAEWEGILQVTRESWRRAYDREPARRGEVALYA